MPVSTVRLTCRHGHVGDYHVSPSRCTDCKTCRIPGECEQCGEADTMALIDGARVPIANSKRNRESTAAAGRGSSSAAPATEAGRQLADYWSRQPPAMPWHQNLSGGPGDLCPRCSRPLQSAGASTALLCLGEDHRLWIRSAAAQQRAAAYLASKARRAPGSDVAVRGSAEAAERSGAELRAERVALSVRKATLRDAIGNAGKTCDPKRFELAEHQQAAKQIRAFLRAYDAEIDRAADVAELGEINSAIAAFARGEDGYATPGGFTFPMLRKQAEQEAEARRRRAEQLEREQLEREYQAEAQRRAEAAQIEAERQAERERKAEAKRQRQAVVSNGSSSYRPSSADRLSTMILTYQQDRARLLAERGACEFQHRGSRQVIAERIYGIAAAYRGASRPDPSYATARACRKHYAEADAWIEQQLGELRASGYQAYYWPLGDAS